MRRRIRPCVAVKLAARAGYSRCRAAAVSAWARTAGSEGRFAWNSSKSSEPRTTRSSWRPSRVSGSRSPSTTCCAPNCARRAANASARRAGRRPARARSRRTSAPDSPPRRSRTCSGARVEDVARFEGPVLAEREHIVGQALAVPVLLGGDLEHDAHPDLRRGRAREARRGRRHGRAVDELEGADRLDRQARVRGQPRSTTTRAGASTRAAARCRR